MGGIITDGINVEFSHSRVPVRLTLPAKLAFDIKRIDGAIDALAKRLGCTPCVSGVDCTFANERSGLSLREEEGLKIDTVPLPEKTKVAIGTWPTPEVHVKVPLKVGTDIDLFKTTFRNVLEYLGCDECHSGWDITFSHERGLFADVNGNVHQFKGM